jgi:hypothetical protein
VLSLRLNERWIHPVRGHGDDGEPFWENGAVGTGTDYTIGESLTVSPAPGQGLRVWARGWDDDTTFIQDNDVNEVLPLVNVQHFGDELAAITPGTSRQFSQGIGSSEVEGAFKVRYTVHNVTKPSPSPGFLLVAGPQYGPNPDTGGRIRVSPATLIQLVESNGVRIEYRFRKLGTSYVSPWVFGSGASLWRVNIGGLFGGTLGLPDGVYAIEYAPISDYGIVGERRFREVEVDSTPPTLGVPSGLKLPATGPTGRAVMWTYTALDTKPGPVTASCDHAPGSFFPIKTVTPVTCRATDAAGNETVKTFNVEVYSPFGYVPDFVALGREWVELGDDVVVESGNVGVFNTSGGVPGSAGFELVIGRRSVIGGLSIFGAKSKLAAHSVKLGQDVRALEDYYVDEAELAQGATHQPRPGYVPLFPGMPIFPLFGASGPDVHVTGTRVLAPGHYSRLEVDPGATVTLSNGGAYYFTEIVLGGKAVLTFTGLGFARVHVTGRVTAGTGAQIGGGAPAQRLVLYVAGFDASANARAFAGGRQMTLFASVYVRNGTLEIGPESTATGAFLGRWVAVGDKVTLSHQKGAFDVSYQ